MANKINWLTIVIAVIAAIVVSIITFNVMSNSLVLAPKPGQQTTINAHRCQADGICETNDLRVSGDAFIGDPTVELPVGGGNLVVEGELHVLGDLLLDEDSTECATFNYESGDGIGDDFCKNAGYDYCLLADTFVDRVTYYDSSDGSCDGDVQLEIEENRISACPVAGGGGGSSGCLQQISNVSEPAFGDYTESGGTSDGRVLCCR